MNWKTDRVTIDGKTMTLNEWCGYIGVPVQVVRNRISRLRLDFAGAIKMGSTRRKNVSLFDELTLTIGGVTKTARQWAHANGIQTRTVSNRLELGWTLERAVTEKMTRRPNKPREGYMVNDCDASPEIIAMCMHCPYDDCIYLPGVCANRLKINKKADE